MTTETKPLTGYDAQYAGDGHGKYNPKVEAPILRNLVLGPAGTKPGYRVIEIGSGGGGAADLLRIHGMKVEAVELSKMGKLAACRDYPSRAVTYRCEDAANLTDIYRPECFALLYARGMSWFHYELRDGENCRGVNVREETAKLMTLVKPGGCFSLTICTNFSGDTPEKGVHQNTLEAYREFMSLFGEIVHESDWRGAPCDPDTKPYSGIIITVRKPE